jgi:glycerophosphoryl diester phosphodiesterase
MIHPHYKDVNREYIEKQHRKNRKVNVWTINEEKEIRKMLNINIDGLITDDPVLGRRIVDR